MKKSIQASVNLITPTEKIIAPIRIDYDDGEEAALPVEIQLRYAGRLYHGNGTDYLWVDAFADLQNKLPEGIKLACCMTCRHGNMCPYGNEANVLFCTKDISIASKLDMVELFDDTDAYVKRAISSVDYCDHFVYQSDDEYTYNDYLYFLKR